MPVILTQPQTVITVDPSSGKVMNEWSCTTTPLICFHAVDKEHCHYYTYY
jgi:hypothetical protein